MSTSAAPDTIFALSSGRGRAGVAVIRISGCRALSALEKLSGGRPDARIASLLTIRDPLSGDVLDRALTLSFPAPASFTGEDVVELHVHGGPAVIEGVLEALSRVDGLREAAPGEFTRRAFENGKLDLTEAEGLADLIDAETNAQKEQALRLSGGGLRSLAESWRDEIIRAMSLVEAAIDFSDEADVPDLVEKQARPVVEGVLSSLISELERSAIGERLREGLRVVLAGAPNAGKSSLMNALSKRDAAIVSSEPGTTRDVIEVHLDLGGYPVTLIDTAGVREAQGEIEQEGIRRTLDRAANADLVIWLVDADNPVWSPGEEFEGKGERISVLNKIDLDDSPPGESPDLAISVATGEGLDRLQSLLQEKASELMSTGEPALVTRARQRRELEACAKRLEDFTADSARDVELLAEELRGAAHALSRLTGRVDVEDVLDRIFGDFCIGK